MGALGWSEAQFWDSTLLGCFAALEGYAEVNGNAAKPAGPDKAKIDELRLRFPDAPKGRRV